MSWVQLPGCAGRPGANYASRCRRQPTTHEQLERASAAFATVGRELGVIRRKVVMVIWSAVVLEC